MAGFDTPLSHPSLLKHEHHSPDVVGYWFFPIGEPECLEGTPEILWSSTQRRGSTALRVIVVRCKT